MRIPPEDQRCEYATSDGKRCRSMRAPEQSLCVSHSQRSHKDAAARERQQQLQFSRYFQTETAALLFPGRRDRLDSARGVNRFLSRVARFVAEARLDPKVGAALCYIGQTILATLPHLARERHLRDQATQHPIFSPEQLKFLDQFQRMLQESSETQEDVVELSATVAQDALGPGKNGGPSQDDE